MALRLYRRHTKGCRASLLTQGMTAAEIVSFQSCRCAIWYCGSLNGKSHQRVSLKVSDWDQAQRKLREIENMAFAVLPLDPDARIRRIEAALEHASVLVGQLTANMNRLVTAIRTREKHGAQ